MTAEVATSTEVVPSTRTHLDKENVQNMHQDNVITTPEDNNDVVEKMTPVVSPSTMTTTKSSAPTVPFTPELLKMYYSRLFPFSMLHSWLSYDPLGKHPQLFSRREFSFTIEPTPGEEIYCRYESFSTAQELKQAVLKRRPHKIDLGAIFSHPPKDRNAVNNFSPVQRELVFDIDLTDYDEVRHCGCKGAAICPKCWTFMNMAVKVMDQGLRDDFGFTKIAWFYSGRRGVHAWVCDECARLLSNEARSAVANYFQVSLGGNENSRSVGLPHPLHPMLSRVYDILEPLFVKYVIPKGGHGVLANQEQWEKFLQTLPPSAERVRDNLMDKWSKSKDVSTPEEKWEALKQHLQVFIGKLGDVKQNKLPKNVSSADRAKIENWPVEAVFRYTYPRLDINVSKMQNHLLKSPFCVHPKTGRVCVPIQVATIDEFDPFSVPTLDQLMQELDDYAVAHPSVTTMVENDGDADMEIRDKKNSTSKGTDVLQDWQKTSLKAYFEPFQKEFLDPLIKSLRLKERDEAEARAAVVGDF